MKNAILALLCSLLLAGGCGTIAVVERLKGDSDVSLSEAILDVAVEDAQAALDDASAHGDKVALACWEPVLVFAKKAQESRKALGSKPSTKGALYAIQRSRDLMMAMDNSGQSDVAIGCAALEKDMARRGIKLAAAIAAISHGVPPTGLLGGLSGIGQ